MRTTLGAGTSPAGPLTIRVQKLRASASRSLHELQLEQEEEDGGGMEDGGRMWEDGGGAGGGGDPHISSRFIPLQR